jgi:hypothetical protein
MKPSNTERSIDGVIAVINPHDRRVVDIDMIKVHEVERCIGLRKNWKCIQTTINTEAVIGLCEFTQQIDLVLQINGRYEMDIDVILRIDIIIAARYDGIIRNQQIGVRLC